MLRHTSKAIIGSKSSVLKGKKIAMGICGSVAAVRCPDLARDLMRRGAEVHPIMTRSAQLILHPYMMEWATGNPVLTRITGKTEHVTLAGENSDRVDLVLIVPATANTIGKIACAIDDTPVTTVVTTAFGSRIPIIIVPAMHESMYMHPILLQNIEKLRGLGVEFVGPRIDEGKAKIAAEEEIIDAVVRKLGVAQDLRGRRVLITAGPTVEHIDPVRVITNKSSGKMGIAIAEEALARGGQVAIVYGPGSAKPPADARVVDVETTQEMYDAVVKELKEDDYDVMIATAAAADWAPERQFNYKVPTRSTPELPVTLKPTPKIIEAVKKMSPKTFLVAFRAEHGLSDNALVESAYQRMKISNADLIAANDVGRSGVGFRTDTNELFIIDKKRKVIHIPLSSKREVAKKLIDVIVEKTKGR